MVISASWYREWALGDQMASARQVVPRSRLEGSWHKDFSSEFSHVTAICVIIPRDFLWIYCYQCSVLSVHFWGFFSDSMSRGRSDIPGGDTLYSSSSRLFASVLYLSSLFSVLISLERWCGLRLYPLRWAPRHHPLLIIAYPILPFISRLSCLSKLSVTLSSHVSESPNFYPFTQCSIKTIVWWSSPHLFCQYQSKCSSFPYMASLYARSLHVRDSKIGISMNS